MTIQNWVTEVRRRGSPLGMHYLCYGLNKYVPYLFGIPFQYSNVVYVDSRLRKLKEEDELLKQLLRDAFERDNRYFLNVASRIRIDAQILGSFVTHSLSEAAVRDTEERHLPRLLTSYVSLMSHFGAYFRLMEPAVSTLETMMSALLHTHLASEKEVQSALLTLCVSPELDYVKRERRALLAIAVNADKMLGETARDTLPAAEYAERCERCPELFRELVSHAHVFGWMGTADHLGAQFSAAAYAVQIHDLKLDPAMELATLEQVDQRQLRTSEKVITQIVDGERSKALVQSAREYDYINAFVKETVLSNQQGAEYLLERIARALEIDRDTLIMFTFEEILGALAADGPLDSGLRRLAAERRDDWAMQIVDGDISLHSGDALQSFRGHFEEPTYSNLDSVRGVPASLGTVTATVRVVDSINEFAILQRGDIIVASMTTPEYNSIMDRITGIITDEGGVTSHAGSLARERRIPCIVGTKIATRVFADNDVVELDADKGVATRLSSGRIPDEAPSGTHHVAPEKRSPSPGLAPILLVEDQTEWQRDLRDALRKEQFPPDLISAVPDDLQARSVFRSLKKVGTPPALVVSDLFLRGYKLAGVELVEHLVGKEDYSPTQVIVYSRLTWKESVLADVREEALARLLECGVSQKLGNLFAKQETTATQLAAHLIAILRRRGQL